MKTYLATIAQVKELTAISDNVAEKHITPYLETAQVLKMKPNLGIVFMDELLAQIATEVSISAATAANPVEVTTDAAHGFATGDSVYVDGATGMDGINGQWTITVLTTTTFELDGLDGTAFDPYDAGTATAMRMPAVNVTIMPVVRVAFAWWVLRDAMPFIWMHITNSTILTQGIGSSRGVGGEGGTPATGADMRWMQQNAQNLAEAYTNDLLRYMSLNSQDYPSWSASCTNIDWVEKGRDGSVILKRNGFKKRFLGV
jgi:hypothetical protein